MHDNSAQARLHEILRVFQLLARYGLMHSPFACRQRRITAVSRTRATTTRRTIGGCLNENAPATTFLRPAECGLFHACLLRLRYSQIHCRALSASRRRAPSWSASGAANDSRHIGSPLHLTTAICWPSACNSSIVHSGGASPALGRMLLVDVHGENLTSWT